MRIVNLARRPFENLRPVRRSALMLWIVGPLLAASNLWLYWGHLTGFSATRGQLAEVRESVAAENARLDELEQSFADLAIEEQNVTVRDLNGLIEKRTFPWSLLFDNLENVLPNDIRLESVRPEGQKISAQNRRRRTQRTSVRGRPRGSTTTAATPANAPRPEMIRIDVSGFARDEVAIEDFIDNLWDDPNFDRPTLKSKNRDSATGRAWRFSLDARFDIAAVRQQALEASGGDGDRTADRGPADEADDGDDAGPRATSDTDDAAPVAGDTEGAVASVEDRAGTASTFLPPATTDEDTLARGDTAETGVEAENQRPSTTRQAPPARTVAQPVRRDWRRESRRGQVTTGPTEDETATTETPDERAAAPRLPGAVVLPTGSPTSGAPSPQPESGGTNPTTPPATPTGGAGEDPPAPLPGGDDDTPAPVSSDASAAAQLRRGGGR